MPPGFHHCNITQLFASELLHSLQIYRAEETLMADLQDPVFINVGIVHFPHIIQITGHGLFTVNMETGFHGIYSYMRVFMQWCGNNDPVQLLLFQHPAVIAIGACLTAGCFNGPLIMRVVVIAYGGYFKIFTFLKIQHI